MQWIKPHPADYKSHCRLCNPTQVPSLINEPLVINKAKIWKKWMSKIKILAIPIREATLRAWNAECKHQSPQSEPHVLLRVWPDPGKWAICNLTTSYSTDWNVRLVGEIFFISHFLYFFALASSYFIQNSNYGESKIKISANPMREAILRTQARSAIDKIHRSSTDALLNIWTDPGNWRQHITLGYIHHNLTLSL